MTTTYTVLDTQGEPIRRHLSATDAMAEILLHDGHDYDIRPAEDGAGFELWVTRFSRNSPAGGEPLVRSLIWSTETDEAKARHDIAHKVMTAWWDRYPSTMTDAEYDKLMAESSEE